MIARIGVVIPARDEEQLIGAALHAVDRAARRVALDVRVIVVADRCTDSTADIARRLGAEVIELDGEGGVGRARAVGSDRALALGADWLAHTDADSTVPANWLVEHCHRAERGADVVIGTVRPRFTDLSAHHIRAWLTTHPRGQSLGHVHGANLGIRSSAYVVAGGFHPLLEHEDVELVERLRAVGRMVETDVAEVITSGRRWGRTGGGYAGYLREQLLPLAHRSS